MSVDQRHTLAPLERKGLWHARLGTFGNDPYFGHPRILAAQTQERRRVLLLFGFQMRTRHCQLATAPRLHRSRWIAKDAIETVSSRPDEATDGPDRSQACSAGTGLVLIIGG